MNTIKTLIALPLFFMASLLNAQKGGDVFIDFGNEKVSKEEFKRVYLKNNSGEMISKSTVDEYLELYINFKLKVKEAEARGLDTVASFVEELAGYRKQLAQPYLSADGIIEGLKKEAYDRLLLDVKARHILILASEDASPDDTLKAYQKIEKVRKMIEDGKDFSEAALEYSEDPSVKTNNGSLGYFTAFYMVYPFESAAYSTKKGDVSEIVRSKFGYHILKVDDKRPAVGNIKVAHILISSDQEISKTDDPEGKIKEIYKKIENGEPFDALAGQFSDDTRSASNGGELQTFGVGRMVPEFEDVAFGLKKDGDISKPFKTQYGWHIMKRIEHYEIGSYEEVERELTSRIKKDSRSNLSEHAVLANIKKQYGFKENIKERNDFYDVLDTSFFKGNWSAAKASKLNKTLFEIGEKKVNQTEFAAYLEKRQLKRKKKLDLRVIINKDYSAFKRQELLAYKNSKLDDEYPEFKALMEEYHDGILLFNLTDELVWSKASKDTVGLENFYEKNQGNYRWKDRVDAVVYSVINEEVGEKIKTMTAEGKELAEMVDEINKSSQLNVRYEQKKYERGENEFVDQVHWTEGFSEMIPNYNRFQLIYIKEVLSPTYKTTEDARGIITSDYQEYLEAEWIKELRNKYEFSVNQAILKKLNNELK